MILESLSFALSRSLFEEEGFRGRWGSSCDFSPFGERGGLVHLRISGAAIDCKHLSDAGISGGNQRVLMLVW